MGFIVGIDAANLRQGGGRTHLIELLGHANPHVQKFEKVIIWAGAETLNLIADQPWLIKIRPASLDKGLVSRIFWQLFNLAKEVRAYKCDLLFVPGGAYFGNFFPVVTMSQNLLPFELLELMRYRMSPIALRLFLLRIIQSISFRRSTGIIFLTQYAKEAVQKVTGPLIGMTEIIPHGIGDRFSMPPRFQKDITLYSEANPYRLLYVSTIDFYKHQEKVIQAVAMIRNKTAWPLQLDLVGPAFAPALKSLKKEMLFYDPKGTWIRYHGSIPYEKVSSLYKEADAVIFASSCENLPIILLESMGAGLPIACSNMGPMPEVLKNFGIFFNPQNIDSIGDAIFNLIDSVKLRANIADGAYRSAQSYSWGKCSSDTFRFLTEVFKQNHF